MAFTSKVLALVARVLGQKYDIKIAMGSYSTASTDGQTIFLPLVQGEDAVALARGYIDHEAAHIRLTNMNIMPTNDFKGQLLNVIEDIRVEKGIGKDYPGCASNLRNLSSTLNEKYGVFQPNPVNPSTSILAWISSRGRVDTLAHDSMIASTESAEPVARDIFGRYFAEAQRLVAMIKTLPEDKSGTLAAQQLRDQFMDLLEQAKEDIDNPPPPSEPQEDPKSEKEEEKEEDQNPSPDQDDDETSGDEQEQGKTAENGDDQDVNEQEDESSQSDTDSEKDTDTDSDPGDDDSAENDGESANDGEEEGDSKTDESSGTGNAPESGDSDSSEGDGDANGQTDAPGGSEGDIDGDDSGSSQNQNHSSSAGLSDAQMKVIAEVLEEALSDADIKFGDIGQLLQKLLGQAAITDYRACEEIPQLPVCLPHPLVKGSRDFVDLAQVKTHTAKLRAQLQGLIQASKLKRSIARRSGRKLDTRNLTRLSVGDDRLFISREEKKGINTAVMFINDGSSSMGANEYGQKMHTATRSCYVAMDAMYSIPGVTSAAVEFNDAVNTVFSLCGWGQKPDSKMFNHNSSACTQISTALWFGWGELMSRPEPRKIAIIFSDGDTCGSDITATHAAIRRMKADGIEFVGIGIQDMNLLDYLPKETRVINDLGQLTPALLELLREKLLEAA